MRKRQNKSQKSNRGKIFCFIIVMPDPDNCLRSLFRGSFSLGIDCAEHDTFARLAIEHDSTLLCAAITSGITARSSSPFTMMVTGDGQPHR